MKNIAHICSSCCASLSVSVADLGLQPLANSYLRDAQAASAESCYPLHAYVCTSCWLVQVPAVARREDIFEDYAYFSSFSDTWRAHCAAYASAMQARLKLSAVSHVIEIASNDGTLLQPFKQEGVKVLGIEPAKNIAAYANERGIETRAAFFGAETARALRAEGIAADLIAANNVLAHVPDLHDFVEGFAILLKPGGTITFEFPHVLEMLRHTQFDTIYHEHFSYLSLTALKPLFARHGLVMVDVERLPTHGGSLRLFLQHEGAAVLPSIQKLLEEEEQFGLMRVETYQRFDAQVRTLKKNLLALLEQLRGEGKRIAAYGAPAKGNTLLNYCGITAEQVAYTVDRNPEKQNRFLPGSHLPIYSPEHILADKPDILFILPWNIAPEVMTQMYQIREWDGKFLVAVPEPRLL